MTKYTTQDAINNGLSHLIDEAEAQNLWLHTGYQDLWFSPSELREENSKGRFVWAPENFSLRSPKERVDELRREKDRASKELSDFIERATS